MSVETIPTDEPIVIRSKKDLEGWEILAVFPWKEGVKQLHLRCMTPGMLVPFKATFVIAYCKDEFLVPDHRTGKED